MKVEAIMKLQENVSKKIKDEQEVLNLLTYGSGWTNKNFGH